MLIHTAARSHIGRLFVPAAMLCGIAAGACAQRPDNIVDVQSVIPDIVLDIRYATAHNFMGRPVPGYAAAKCLLTRDAADALAQAQNTLQEFGLGLKVYDCYRPQSAVDAFVAWGRDLDDQAMKAEFYPSEDKRNLFADGYIAAQSGHSRGSTMDLTIVPLPAAPIAVFDPAEGLRSCEIERADRFPDTSIDMGTGYDCFSTRSHTIDPRMTAQQRANRLLLDEVMQAAGFVNLPEEWWHFTLKNEPYPDTYFDFPVD